jgi:hypothetical protein
MNFIIDFFEYNSQEIKMNFNSYSLINQKNRCYEKGYPVKIDYISFLESKIQEVNI